MRLANALVVCATLAFFATVAGALGTLGGIGMELGLWGDADPVKIGVVLVLAAGATAAVFVAAGRS